MNGLFYVCQYDKMILIILYKIWKKDLFFWMDKDNFTNLNDIVFFLNIVSPFYEESNNNNMIYIR